MFMCTMSNFALSNGRTAGGQYSWPIRNCFRLRVFVGVPRDPMDVFLPVFMHAAQPRALSPRDKRTRTLCPFPSPFHFRFPYQMIYVCTRLHRKCFKAFELFLFGKKGEKVCEPRCAIEGAKFRHSATPRPYPWHTSFHRALPRCFRSYF